MYRQRDAFDAADVVTQIPKQLPELIGHRIADRIGNIDCGRASLDDRLHHLREEIHLRAGGILGREFDIIAVFARDFHAFHGATDDLLLRHVELVLTVNGAGGQKDVQTAPRGRRQSARSQFDVLARAARQPRDDGFAYLAGNRVDRFPVTAGGSRKARLDDIYAQIRQRTRHTQLFGCVMLQPGACSPSRSVVSKITTRSPETPGAVPAPLALPAVPAAAVVMAALRESHIDAGMDPRPCPTLRAGCGSRCGSARLLQPGHARTQLLTDPFDRMARVLFQHAAKILRTILVLLDPLARELAALDLLEDLAHLLLGAVVDHTRPARQIAVLGRVADELMHLGQTALMQQIDDQLELVQTLVVGHFRLVAGSTSVS